MVEASKTRKKAILAPKILQAHVSNVKESFYLFDHSKALSSDIRNMLINHQIETLLQSKLYGAVVLLSFRNIDSDLQFRAQDLSEKFAAIKKSPIKVEVQCPSTIKGVPGRKERLTVFHKENLILVNLQPCFSKNDQTSCYHFLRGAANKPQALTDLLVSITKQLKLTQASLVIDRLEYMTSLFGQQDTLKFIKLAKHQSSSNEEEKQTDKVLYPFFGHIDFSMVQRDSGNFEAKVCKLQNGLLRLESTSFNKKNNSFSAKMYASVVKSGCRFQDELVELVVDQQSGSGLIQLYLDLGDVRDENDMTQAIRKKEKAVKASFKIQITDEERKQRDSQQTTEYHTGAGMVTLDKEDQEEL